MLNTYRDTTYEMCEMKGWNRVPIERVWFLLTEEIGELASAIRKSMGIYQKIGVKKIRGTDVQMEMGDVFSYLFQIASMMDIDLDEMWYLHQNKFLDKTYT